MSVALFLLLSILSVGAQEKTQVIAHRGYWKTEGSAQNSLASLQKAAEARVFGSEFDVHLTADNKLVVFHDDEVEGIKIQENKYKAIKSVRLTNGEKIPTLKQYLKKGKKLKNVELIFELKSHATPEREDEAARRSVKMVERMGLADRTTYIAFSRYAAEALHRYAPEAEVYYLNGDLSPKQLKELGFAGLDYHYKVMQQHPEWFKEAKELKLKVNVWTVNEVPVMKEMIEKGADFLTTDHPEEALQAVQSYR